MNAVEIDYGCCLPSEILHQLLNQELARVIGWQSWIYPLKYFATTVHLSCPSIVTNDDGLQDLHWWDPSIRVDDSADADERPCCWSPELVADTELLWVNCRGPWMLYGLRVSSAAHSEEARIGSWMSLTGSSRGLRVVEKAYFESASLAPVRFLEIFRPGKIRERTQASLF